MPARSPLSVVPLALFAAFLVVGLNTWFAVAATNALIDSEAWLAHTWEVIGEEEHLMLTMVTAESAVRGYLNTGRPDVLAPYQQAKLTLPQDLQKFKDLTLDNPVQQQTVDDARAVVERRLQALDTAVAAYQKGGIAEAIQVASTREGTSAMDAFRASIGRMDSEERRLLANRSGEVHHNGQRMMFAIGLACVLDLLMIGFVTYYFGQERKQRLETEEKSRELAIANDRVEKTAAEIRTLNAELEQRVRERTSELETTNRELEAFSYSVSHDLRAPLRTIDGFSLALQEDYADAVDDIGRDYIGRVRAGVQRMGQLIDALLQLSRITRADLVREKVDLNKLAAGVVETLKEDNPGRDMEFIVTPGPEQSADPKLVQVALENLLGNAVKFTSRREHAIIQFGWDEEKQAWRVSDNGAGFDMFYADKLFNAFNRLHGDKDFKGSGIGLATVARVIRRHHGRIWADSEVDHGATFWFTLG